MNKIGFQNFRRFIDFPPIEYGGITFLVGRNNAGKSTLVKAIILIDNYFKSKNYPKFSFGNNILEDANIVTFGRAKNHFSSSDVIEFYAELEDYGIGIIVSGEEDKSFANVALLSIHDLQEGVEFSFDYINNTITIRKQTGTSHISVDFAPQVDLELEIEDIENEIKLSKLKKTSKEYIELITLLDSLKKKKTEFNKTDLITKPKQTFNLTTDFSSNLDILEIVLGAIRVFKNNYDYQFKLVQEGKKASSEFEDLRAFKEFEPIMVESIFTHFTTLIHDFSIAYLGASSTKQSALFAIRDKNNALAQAIHEYVQLGIKKGEDEYLFVTSWMKEFEIGSDFEIKIHAGEAYEVLINSNNHVIQLADKGMGSIQAMLLILRIACVIKKIKNAEKNSTASIGKKISDSSKNRLIDKTTIIIEEPELNLHPALQSKITDLLFYTYEKYKIDFLIETHSEYIVRRSQVLVIEKDLALTDLSSNPFKAYYFDNDKLPYGLNYNADGTFDKNFGKGFFDEASSSTLELIKLKRQKSS